MSLTIIAVVLCVFHYSVLGQTGVSLQLKGADIVNDGYVDVSDIGMSSMRNPDGLLCTTDSTDCCSQRNQGDLDGHWYYPNDTRVEGFTVNRNAGRTVFFARNRDPGVVRLYRTDGDRIPPESGRFYCRAPNVMGNVQTVYVNILDIGAVTISSSGSSTAGESYSLMCSATISPNPLPTDVPSPTFEWFFDPNNSSLPSGVTPPVTTNSGSIYTSTLLFSPLSQSHEGMYTCRLGGNERLATRVTVTVSLTSTTTPPLSTTIMATTTASSTSTTLTGVTTVTAAPPVSIAISISPSGTNSAGESYSLECSVSVTGSTDTPTVTWLDPMNNQITSGARVMTTGSVSRLTFNPLAVSDAGRYTCSASVGGVTEEQEFTVLVNVISVRVTPSTGTNTSPLRAGLTGFSLDCDVSGTDNLNSPTFIYQWRMDGRALSGQQERALSLSLLVTSHAGQYTCQVTVSSSSLSSDNTVTSNPQTVNIQLPAPLTVSVSHGQINIGSVVTLTCTVQLSSAVDVPVTVSTVWSGPAEFTPVTNSVMESLTRYTSTAMVSSFGSELVGEYTCTSGISSTSPSPYLVGSTATTGTARITAGVYLSLKGVVYANNSLISITEIGETTTTSNTGLQCVTDRRPCCFSEGRAGEWFFPDGMRVPFGDSATFYRNRGDDGTVNLNRLNTDIMSPTGLFCCVVPDAIGTMQRVCANITTDLVLRISYSVVPMVPYSLSCQVTGTSSTINTYQWRKDGTLLSETGATLSFSSLSQSDAGQYICEVIVNGVTFTSQARVITLTINPPPTVSTNPTSPSNSPPTNPDSNPANSSAGVIAGVVAVVVILVIVGVVVAVLILLLWLRRRSSKPYAGSSGKSHAVSPVSYTRTHNGDNVTGVGKLNRPQILKFPTDASVTEGEGVYFKIKVSGAPQPTVTWYHDDEPVKTDYAREIESDGSLTIVSTEQKHSGVYKAVVANVHGSQEKELKLTVSEEGGASPAVAIADMVSSSPIPIPEFGKYVAELHANSNQRFKDLYRALDTGEHGQSTRYAISEERRSLNRFANIVVYDDNRISLEPLSGVEDCQEDYINACYIDGYSVPNKFIATQGPLPKTVVDFWRLIWQEHPPTIVMVTNITEGTRIKCQQYWPESGKKDFGPFQVTITDQQIFADYTIRTFSVSLGSGRSYKVTQYHFTAWPDHGVPDYATPILAFHRRVKAQHHPSRGPMVVHCSAGVGRTGTLIAIDNVLEQIEKEQVVDIPGAITKIRQRRMKMVQNYEQFAFIHDAILESVTCGDTQIAATNLRTMLNRMKRKDPLSQLNTFQHQFKILEQVSPNPDDVPNKAALRSSNKNRARKFLPADRWRVILKGEVPDYIHAVYINGYKHHKAFIVAEGPMQSTVRNFWKMIYDRKSAVIVMVSDLVEEGQEASAQYWPDSGFAQYGEYTVEILTEEALNGFTIRELSVHDRTSQQAHRVTQFHITCWSPDGHCSNLKSVTDVIEEMTKVQIRSGNKPIVVHCSDTVTRSGMFCAIATTIERCKTEGVVDVFQVVKALRVQKPGAVPTVSQYQAVFETVLVFLESFDTYANFQNI